MILDQREQKLLLILSKICNRNLMKLGGWRGTIKLKSSRSSPVLILLELENNIWYADSKIYFLRKPQSE